MPAAWHTLRAVRSRKWRKEKKIEGSSRPKASLPSLASVRFFSTNSAAPSASAVTSMPSAVARRFAPQILAVWLEQVQCGSSQEPIMSRVMRRTSCAFARERPIPTTCAEKMALRVALGLASCVSWYFS